MPTSAAALILMQVCFGNPPSDASYLGSSGVELEEAIAGGVHWKIRTAERAVHVWRPDSYDARRAGTVVYVHGYFVDADAAWSEHHLAEQFAASGRQALFIVPEAAYDDFTSPRWASLNALLSSVSLLTHARRAQGPVVVVAHSGGFRSVLNWLSNPRLKEIVLLDGLYNGQDMFRAWLRSGRRMILASSETYERAEEMVKSTSRARSFPAIPEDVLELGRSERQTKLLSFRSQFEHMEMITHGRVVPVLLRLTSLGAL